MKKLSLDLEALQVESFSTAAEQAPARGTVQGHLMDSNWNCTRPPEIPTVANCWETIVGCGGTDYNCNTESQYWACNPQPTQFDPSCGGTCNGAASCYDSVCIPL